MAKRLKNYPIQRITPPETVQFSLDGFETDLKKGDVVLTGESIARSQSGFKKVIHSPLNGVVTSINDHIKISGEWANTGITKKHINPDDYSSDEIILKIQEAGIVGMGGAMFPTYAKFRVASNIDYVIVNASESDPYLSSDYRVLRECIQEVECGMHIAMKAVGAKKGIISKPHREYAAGYESLVVKETLGIEIPKGRRPHEYGVIVINVQTARAIHQLFCQGKPLIERVITIDGTSVEKPGNYTVPLGTSFSHILKTCGFPDRQSIFTGGPLMGNLAKMEETVLAGTAGVFAFHETELLASEGSPCIRCGKCLDACPLELFVTLLIDDKHIEIMECIECGACQYICPAGRPLMQKIRELKEELQDGDAKNIS